MKMKNSPSILAIALALSLVAGCKADQAVAAPETPTADIAAQAAALAQAAAAFQSGDYAACSQHASILIGTDLGQQYNIAYNSARCYALAGEAEKALELLELPEILHLNFVADIESDQALETVRALPAWTEVHKQLQTREQELQAKMDQPLREEAVTRAARYIELRQMLEQKPEDEATLSAQIRTQSQADKEWLKKALSEKGWPGVSIIGIDGVEAISMLLMDVEMDTELQRLAIDGMEKAGPLEFDPQIFTRMTDRVLLAEGKKQRFGTVFSQAADGTITMPEAESTSDEELDKLRLQYGLSPIAEHRKQLMELHGGKFATDTIANEQTPSEETPAADEQPQQ